MDGLRLNREKFYSAYRERFGEIKSQRTVDGLNYILDRFDTETRLKNIPQFSYILATAKHESGKRVNRVWTEFQPVKETRELAGSPRRANQDRYWFTGYYGRGLVQTTWEDNYLTVGNACGVGDLFVKEPALLLEPKWAYEALLIGMTKGLYRKDENDKPHTLDRYINDHASDFYNAREIVNGDKRKKGRKIAETATHFESIINFSLENDDEDFSAGNDSVDGFRGYSETTGNQQTKTIKTEQEISTEQKPLGDSPDAPATQVGPTGVKRWYGEIFGTLIAGGTGVWAFLTSEKGMLLLAFVFGMATILAVVFRNTIDEVVRKFIASDPNRKNVK